MGDYLYCATYCEERIEKTNGVQARRVGKGIVLYNVFRVKSRFPPSSKSGGRETPPLPSRSADSGIGRIHGFARKKCRTQRPCLVDGLIRVWNYSIFGEGNLVSPYLRIIISRRTSGLFVVILSIPQRSSCSIRAGSSTVHAQTCSPLSRSSFKSSGVIIP